MEESQEILVNSLNTFNIVLPPEVSSIGELDAAMLFSVFTQVLHRARAHRQLSAVEAPPLPDSLPESLPERVRILSDVASALRTLGYIGDISFHKLLYPSEEDLYRLVRFLVGKLSEISEAGKLPDLADVHSKQVYLGPNDESTLKDCTVKIDPNHEKARAELQDLRIEHALTLPSTKHDSAVSTEEFLPATEKVDQEVLVDDKTLKNLEARPLDEGDDGIVTEVEKMALDDHKPTDVRVQQLNIQIEDRKRHLKKLQNRLDDSRKHLEDRKMHLLESFCVNNPEAQIKLQELKKIEIETQTISFEIRKREEECAKLSLDLEKQPKVASRRSYVQRITEITKNRRKQDVDIERILKETRELQLESNSVEERLHRTYAVVDEMVFREASQDTMGRQPYKLLTSIHDSFGQMRQKILETDRTKREVADIESKLALMTSRNLDMEKLQADLDSIKRENDYLEQRLQNQ